MVTVAAVAPHLRGLGEKHAIGEGHHQLPARAGDTQELGGHSFWVLQILPTSHDQGGINARAGQRNLLVEVEVLQPMAIEAFVGRQLLFVEAVADHPFVDAVVWEVRHPARHQIQHHGPLGDPLAVELGEPLAKGFVEMVHKARFAVEEPIVAAIPLPALGVGEYLNRHTHLATAARP